ncbi:Arc family DNA-binding protein [Psychrobacter sp. UBA2514]|jgi:plasmid stability protein|uniref:Arc family DNA-binding protein n=1 Tax=Psychrobacter sp. UBA2514 TaxID=1947346 RepID=UPI002579D556|nr:Arc family DNA-binding protein [Psychrobacter sp. UBA2514]|tara:strand:- start:24176 stop:24454 length:279 start_codon:yes stop_codon:yes gene_type:complete
MTLQTEPQYKLRLPEELRDKIKESAKEHVRSMNADIVARLEASFATEESPPKPISVPFDDSFLKDAGLTREQFGAFVRKSISDSLKEDKGSD